MDTQQPHTPPENHSDSFAPIAAQAANSAAPPPGESARPLAPPPAAERPATAPGRQPAAPRRLPRRRSPYRNVALALTGLVLYALFILIGSLIWGASVYMGEADAVNYTGWPLAIYLLAVFLASFLITLLSRGGTIYPSFALALAAAALAILLSGEATIVFSGVLLKLLLSIVAATVGFSVGKIIALWRWRRRVN